MKKILCIALMLFFPVAVLQAAGEWEKQGNFYFLTKKTRQNFSATGAGANKFVTKYLTYDGLDFLVRGADDWKDYGRLNLEGNNLFLLPMRPGIKAEEVHFLSGGNFGNSYKHDQLLSLYGDNYYYAVITVIFVYQDGIYKALSVPVFWDWFHLGQRGWSKDGASVKYIGNNPARKDCSIYHMSFVNPRPAQPLKDILVTDSWLSDFPFSEIFAVTLKSSDTMEAMPREGRQFKPSINSAALEPGDKRTEWMFSSDFDGWVAGCSGNWDVEPFWQADSFARKGVLVIPACNWGGDKFSWIEKKVAFPEWGRIKLGFLRHSAVYSELDKVWSDGLLRVIVRGTAGQETVYDKLYSGEWSMEEADLSRYKGQTAIIRFENHGGGRIRLSQTTSAACDGEDAVIDDIRLIKG
ncbi:MAG: hypothetical protein NT033_10315 [Candidatus Omnitrophica bacterium]|nr:hypothetical protein [Candidatus Omnitrophota bacterium]